MSERTRSGDCRAVSRRVCAMVACLMCVLPPATAQLQLVDAFPHLSFSQPVDIQSARDGSMRLFVVEQSGRIRVFATSDTTTQSAVFLDISDRVVSGGELGLLGLAFHPQHQTNGLFFVNYTASNPRRTVIARCAVESTNPNAADTATLSVLLEVNQPYTNHNGGQIAFGPDGYLYIALGDGGSGGDPLGNGQNRTTLLGSILRIDVDSVSPPLKYAIPSDNPFVGNINAYREEIFAYGLRNPWRFSFDSHTGRLWVADVGQGTLEEIDIVLSGGNYGWNTMEGSLCYAPSSGCDTSGLVLPVWEYGRGLGNSVTGGYVYRGSMVPVLEGQYIYGDFGSGRIWALSYDGVGPTVNTEILQAGFLVSTFGVDESNELYVADYSNGRIFRLESVLQTYVDPHETLPSTVLLHQNYPNPFNASTHIRFDVSQATVIQLSIRDLLGREIKRLASGTVSEGSHVVRWDGLDAQEREVPSGVYWYQLRTESGHGFTRRLIFLK